MTGFRIGYVVADGSLVDKMANLQALCLTNVSEPIQYVALKGIEEDTSENTNTIKKRLELLIKKARKMNLDFIDPDGAMYLFVKLKEVQDTTEFCNKLLDFGLALAPGGAFGDYNNFLRISACQEENKLMEGMEILENVLRSKR